MSFLNREEYAICLHKIRKSKATYVERVIKTIKSKMYRYFSHKHSYNYVKDLQTFANSYNKTYHRTIGMSPDRVTKGKETNLWWKMYWQKSVKPEKKTKKVRKPFRFKVVIKSDSHILEILSRENTTRNGPEKYSRFHRKFYVVDYQYID